jgi:hypothetical protein
MAQMRKRNNEIRRMDLRSLEWMDPAREMNVREAVEE